MTLTDLIKSAEEKLAKPDLTLGTRRREEAILHHLTSLERTVTELESQNTELYVDLCEMGDEPKKNTERVHLYTDDTETQQFFLGGNMFYELTIDKMIRHKWPEEEPEEGQYLVARRYKYGDGKLRFTLASYWFDQRYDGEVYSPESEGADKWGYIKNPKKIEMCWMESSDDGCRDMSDEVVYWWNLPEVTE